jgi:hypothetical protein
MGHPRGAVVKAKVEFWIDMWLWFTMKVLLLTICYFVFALGATGRALERIAARPALQAFRAGGNEAKGRAERRTDPS